MKKSNKLMVAFLILMLILMVVYNFLLKDQYVKGNITRRDEPAEISNYKTITLKPFRHVVFNGQLLYEFNGRKKALGNVQGLIVNSAKSSDFRLQVSKTLSDVIDYSYKGDTLFVGYRLKTLQDKRFNYYSVPPTLFAPALASISGSNGIVTVGPVKQNESLELHVNPRAEFSVQNIELPNLNMWAGAGAKVSILSASVDTLSYDLNEQSELKLQYPYSIKALRPGKTDSASVVTLMGSARIMEEIMPSQLNGGATPTKIVTEK